MKKIGDGIVAANPVFKLEHIMTFIFKHQIVNLFPPNSRIFSTKSRDSASTTRGSFFPWMTSMGQATCWI